MAIQKIIEIKTGDWMKGNSAQPNIAVGGLFQSLSGVDPFEQGGLMLPSLMPDNATTGIATTPKFLTNWNLDGVGYLYIHTNSKLYQMLAASPYTVVDKSSSIVVTDPVQGAIVWGGKYIYAVKNSNFEVRAWDFASSDIQILQNRNTGVTGLSERPMCVGADGNLYIGDFGAINKCIINSGTSGNTVNSTTSLNPDYDMKVRALVNDGRYLVAFADNNVEDPTARLPGAYKCRIYFWDMQKTQSGGTSIQPDIIYDLPGESYIVSAKIIDGQIYFIGYNGIYVCNSATNPKLIRPYPFLAGGASHRPVSTAQIIAFKGSIYWVDPINLSYGTIAAYGNPITGQQKVFYEPYLFSGGYTPTCMNNAGSTIYLGTDQPGIFIFNVGTTRGGGNMSTLDLSMTQPHTYGYVKIDLSRPMVSGESVQVVATAGNGQLSAETQSYNAASPRQTLLFRPVKTAANQPDKFVDIRVLVANTKVPVQRIAVYATPLDDTEASF